MGNFECHHLHPGFPPITLPSEFPDSIRLHDYADDLALATEHIEALVDLDAIGSIMDVRSLANERILTWPMASDQLSHNAQVYEKVRSTGLPNSLQARVPIKSSLNLDFWHEIANRVGCEPWLLDMLNCGFPLQYCGGKPNITSVNNHSSAIEYPEQVNTYIQKELSEGALAGPFEHPPFKEWNKISPLMTRPKSASTTRRIIVDLSYPQGEGVNAAVQKGIVFGQWIEHKLPSIDQALAIAETFNFEVVSSVIDIERAYRNFRSDPLDWPLLVLEFQNKFYVDLALPFGARLSSLYVQKLADLIVRALATRGIHSLMYLDDLYLLCPRSDMAQSQFNEAMYVIRKLGLPINYKKLIPPSTQSVWLGVHFDFSAKCISIPQAKVNDLLDTLQQFSACQHIALRQAQSIAGKMAQIARVIHPARIFMSRLLEQIRASDSSRVYINHAVLSDFRWYLTFFEKHNAKSLMRTRSVDFVIEADSSLSAGGAFSDDSYYIHPYSPRVAAAHNICQLEALNYLVAARAFISGTRKGQTCEIVGDNQGAINGLSSGRATDSVLAAVARALWYHAARTGVTIKFTHRPGESLVGADALSRAPISEAHRKIATDFVESRGLRPVKVFNAYINYSKFD